MLFKHHYIHLFNYNNQATKETIQSIKLLPEPSDRIISLISHIIAAQEIWFNRTINKNHDITPWEVYSNNECSEKSDLITERWIKFLEHTSDEGLNKIIHYSNTKGDKFENSIKDIITHIINHSTYHRAQIALLVKEAGGKPAVTDYIVYARSISSKHC
jgi:uncharacterized damage-inducible protein DinB